MFLSISKPKNKEMLSPKDEGSAIVRDQVHVEKMWHMQLSV